MDGMSKELRRFNYLVGEIDAAYHEAALNLGLSDSAMRILYVLCGCGMQVLYTVCAKGERCPLRDICRQSGMSKQTVNSALRKLEGEGLAFLEPIGTKGKDVCLTDAGQALAEGTVARLIAVEDAILGSWPAEDVEKYLSLAEQYLTAFREKAKHLGNR